MPDQEGYPYNKAGIDPPKVSLSLGPAMTDQPGVGEPLPAPEPGADDQPDGPADQEPLEAPDLPDQVDTGDEPEPAAPSLTVEEDPAGEEAPDDLPVDVPPDTPDPRDTQDPEPIEMLTASPDDFTDQVMTAGDVEPTTIGGEDMGPAVPTFRIEPEPADDPDQGGDTPIEPDQPMPPPGGSPDAQGDPQAPQGGGAAQTARTARQRPAKPAPKPPAKTREQGRTRNAPISDGPIGERRHNPIEMRIAEETDLQPQGDPTIHAKLDDLLEQVANLGVVVNQLAAEMAQRGESQGGMTFRE